MAHAMATDAVLRDLVEDGEPVSPDCPYCDEPISGETRNYGGGLMHRGCYDEFGEDMESVFPDELAPINPRRFEHFEPDWVQPEWETTQLLELAEAESRRIAHVGPSENVPF